LATGQGKGTVMTGLPLIWVTELPSNFPFFSLFPFHQSSPLYFLTVSSFSSVSLLHRPFFPSTLASFLFCIHLALFIFSANFSLSLHLIIFLLFLRLISIFFVSVLILFEFGLFKMRFVMFAITFRKCVAMEIKVGC
jgi:hypothetical protein